MAAVAPTPDEGTIMAKHRTPDVDLGELVDRAAAINAQISDLTEQLDAIKSLLRNVLAPGDTLLGSHVVTISPNYRFDPKRAYDVIEADYPTRLADVLTTSVDRVKAKSILPPEVYEKCQAEFSPRVTIKEID